MNALIKHATVRRNIVVQLICVHRDARHPDYNVDLRRLEEPTDAPTIPNGLVNLLKGEEDNDAPFLGVDKAATPAQRSSTRNDLEKRLQRARPLIFMAQRDSDANKNVEANQVGAVANFSEL